MNDRKRLENLRRRKKYALEEIMEEYGGYVSLIVYNTMGNGTPKEDREEAVADVFISLWEKADVIGTDVYLKGYLAAMARNKARDRLRSIAAKRRRGDIAGEGGAVCSGGPSAKEDGSVFDRMQWSESLGDETADLLPEASAVYSEEKGVLQEAIQMLGEPECGIFDRYYFSGEPIAVIAASLEMKEATVKTKLSRGRQKLRKILKEGGYFDA